MIKLKVTVWQHGTPHKDIQHNSIQHYDTQYNGLICDTQHNSIACHYAECRDFIAMLSVVMLNVVKLSVMAPIA